MVAGLVSSPVFPHHHHQGELSGTIPASLPCAVSSQGQGRFSHFQAFGAGLSSRVSSTALPRQGAGSALMRFMTLEPTPAPVMGGDRRVGHLSLTHATVWQMNSKSKSPTHILRDGSWVPLSWLIFIKFIFKYVPVCLSECVHMRAVPAKTTGGHQILLDMDLQVVVRSCLTWMQEPNCSP